MAVRTHQIFIPLFVCVFGQPWSAALANEGSLILPETTGSNVELQDQTGATGREASDSLQVFVGPASACCHSKSPIAGTYQRVGTSIIFDPAFDFLEGQIYTVQSQFTDTALTEFTIAPKAVATAPEVLEIYPSGDDIPENTLRFYIHFSTPMTPHMADRFIKLVDASGSADENAFMSFTQELWNEDRTRLTLLMDPGRIKRGVAQNLTLGPALLEGNSYSLVIEDGWSAAKGGQFAPRFEKPFTVSQPLRSLPDTALWQFERPRLMTNDALVIAFDRPFDRHLAQTAIAVRDADGRAVAGTVSVGPDEKTWRFVPNGLWATDRLELLIDARLEDVAGNNFKDLLDHSVGTALQSKDYDTVILDLKTAP